jgi:hypothetical protein
MSPELSASVVGVESLISAGTVTGASRVAGSLATGYGSKPAPMLPGPESLGKRNEW